MLDPMHNAPHINSLRSGVRELSLLLDKLDTAVPAMEGASHADREFVRWRFRDPFVEVQVDHPGGNRQTLRLVSRNLSRQGISLLHSAFVYPGTPCRVVFKETGSRGRGVRGIVKRCEHRGGRVHELGIKFDEEISTKDILGLDPMREGYSIENVRPERLQGSLIVVASSELDEQIILKMLDDTSMQLGAAREAEAVRARMERGCDLLLIDSLLEGGRSGIDLLAELRSEGFDASAVILTADASESCCDAARAAGANGMMFRPVSKFRLMQAAAEFLLGESDGGPIYTTLKPSDGAYELLGRFLGDLPRTVLNIEAALRADDKETCRQICRSLIGTAEPMGYAEIGRAATRANLALDRVTHPREVDTELRGLMITCRRVKHRAA
jgi:CheY-like chemotaxis protein